MCSAKYDFNIPDLLCPKPLMTTGLTCLPTSLYQWTFRKTILTDQIIHTLENDFVYFCM